MRRNHQTQIRAGPTDIERGGCGACSLLALSHNMTCDRRQATGDKRAWALKGARGEARQGEAGIGASWPVSKPENPHEVALFRIHATNADTAWDAG